MLKINNLTVSAGDKIILKDFNLNINSNEIHTLMGLNGSGKSTICKVLMGDPNYKVESGNIYLPDETVDPDIEEVVDQLLKFPNVAHDEYVDTTSQYLLDYSYKHDGARLGTDSRYALFSNAIRGFRV